MKIVAKDKIAGVSILVVRAALKKNVSFDHGLQDFASFLKMEHKQAALFVKRLADDGYLTENTRAGVWENTTKGNALAHATTAPLVSRVTASKALAGLVLRASTVNNDPKYAFMVVSITVFGSFLSERPEVSDVDVSIKLRPRFSVPAQTALEAEARKRNISYRSFIDDLCWPQTEVLRFLKTRSRILHFAGEVLPDGAQCQVVFAENARGA